MLIHMWLPSWWTQITKIWPIITLSLTKQITNDLHGIVFRILLKIRLFLSCVIQLRTSLTGFEESRLSGPFLLHLAMSRPIMSWSVLSCTVQFWHFPSKPVLSQFISSIHLTSYPFQIYSTPLKSSLVISCITCFACRLHFMNGWFVHNEAVRNCSSIAVYDDNLDVTSKTSMKLRYCELFVVYLSAIDKRDLM